MDEAVALEVGGETIACLRRPGKTPGLVWLGGYRSQMTGTKAEALAGWASAQGRAFLRHDYSGHGRSSGAFRDGTMSAWLEQSLAAFSALSEGPQVLVGSSMGAWIALRMVEELGRAGEEGRVAGLVLVAPAPDFTSDLVEPALTRKQKAALARDGFVEEPSAYGAEPDIFTQALLEDGRKNRVLVGRIDTRCPVHILQGLMDREVPHAHALKLVSHLPADDVTLSLVPDGDHRLSRPQDLEVLFRAVASVLRQAAA